MVLRSYGLANLRNFLRGHVRMAKDFEEMVAADGRFEVVVPRYFAMVCFRLLPPDGTGGGEETAANEINQRLLEAANASGKVYMTHAVVGGVYLIRFAVGTTLTEEWHVRAAWKVVVARGGAAQGALNNMRWIEACMHACIYIYTDTHTRAKRRIG
uniref:Uncharacterized protein n=1 Tax=Ananas comosus var. bracteatus TaxID=296719 RepID=A0A6V7NRB2_ANACO|nr:unnamed protein product [Ananas comosus var. bracteatus]